MGLTTHLFTRLRKHLLSLLLECPKDNIQGTSDGDAESAFQLSDSTEMSK